MKTPNQICFDELIDELKTEDRSCVSHYFTGMLAFLLLPGFMPYSPYDDDVRVCKPAKLVVEIIRDLSKSS